MKLYVRLLMGLMTVWMSCIDKVDLSLPASELPLIIDGLVTDDPGPYTVKISRAFPVDGLYHSAQGVTGAQVVITDGSVGKDVLTEVAAGYYLTDTLQGVVGRTYRLRVTTAEGLHFESTPESMGPSGTLGSIYFEFVRQERKEDQIEVEGFNVFVNATSAPGSSQRIRWKFDGTYKIITNPGLLTVGDPPTPIACSLGCVCCTCWVSEREATPILTNNTFLGSDQLTRVFMKYIPINGLTFTEKYRVEITQMGISAEAYDFYAAVRGQIDNASSLFQPPFFELKGNLRPTDNETSVVGIFSAAAVTRKSIFIYRKDIPHILFPQETIGDCRAVAPNSSIVEPPFWQ